MIRYILIGLLIILLLMQELYSCNASGSQENNKTVDTVTNPYQTDSLKARDSVRKMDSTNRK